MAPIMAGFNGMVHVAKQCAVRTLIPTVACSYVPQYQLNVSHFCLSLPGNLRQLANLFEALREEVDP